MHRFFVSPGQIEDGQVTIDGEDFKHITRVLRLRDDEAIEVCDGRGTDHIVMVETVGKDSLTGRILESRPSRGETDGLRVTLFQGVPKGQKMESVIQKCVEAGAASIVPFTSVRTVVKLGDKEEKKTRRWQRVAYEAAKQSKRGVVPHVAEATTLSAVADTLDNYDLVLIAYEGEEKNSLKSVISSLEFDPERIAVIVGPEGGFAPDEVAMIEEAGGYSVSLGRRILRTETAGVVLLAQLNFFYED